VPLGSIMKNTNKVRPVLLLLYVALATQPVALAQKRAPHAATGNVSRSNRPAPAILVGPNVQVSKEFSDKPHGEIHLAANPRNPANLVGGSMVRIQEMNTETVVAYASFDGGKTWSATLRFNDSFYHSDPAVAFDSDGTAYFLQITNTNDREPKYSTHLYRSKDGGRSWLEPTIIPMLDRHYVAVDDGAGKHQGSVYINGVSTREVRVQRSRNRGVSFDGEVKAAVAPSTRMNAGLSQLVVLSDSTLVIPFADLELPIPDVDGSPTRSNAALKVVTSIDGGNTFSEPVTIAPIAIGHTITSNSHHFSFATQRSTGPFQDRLYVTWSDSYSGGGQFSAKKPGGSNILFSYSADKGKSWSKPILINDDHFPLNPTDAPVHFQPVVAVNKEGVVGVMYYDRRDSSNNLDWTVRFAASLDGGETFLPTVPVAESPNRYGGVTKIAVDARSYGGGHMPPNKNYRGGTLKFDLTISQFTIGGGHTAGLAADANGVFHPFWVDNRTGVAQVWTAPVTVNRKAMPNGDPELTTLQDVSEKMILNFTNPTFDLRTGRLSVDIKMQNTSEDTIVLPVKLRVISLTCGGGGIPTIVGADNDMERTGAVWDLEQLLVDKKLKPNQTSRVRRLEFNITDMPPLSEAAIRSRGWGALELIHVEARVLANVQRTAPATTTEK
jgi:BNR/Asp-box repeat protein